MLLLVRGIGGEGGEEGILTGNHLGEIAVDQGIELLGGKAARAHGAFLTRALFAVQQLGIGGDGLGDPHVGAKHRHPLGHTQQLADGRGIKARRLRHRQGQSIDGLAFVGQGIETGLGCLKGCLHILARAAEAAQGVLECGDPGIRSLALIGKTVAEFLALAADEAHGHAALLLQFVRQTTDGRPQGGQITQLFHLRGEAEFFHKAYARENKHPKHRDQDGDAYPGLQLKTMEQPQHFILHLSASPPPRTGEQEVILARQQGSDTKPESALILVKYNTVNASN
ncbi:hypothetical protein MCP1_60027 [Candidatus Terasakiella magnetica]|nr:hypothetical protein MCP1_60027 [Candidatus Terasakiella magnetica]